LGNRQRVISQLESAAETAKNNGAWLGIALMDLDRFKQVNDRYGRAAGDAVLWRVAQELEDALLVGESVGRVEPDEFLVLMPGSDPDTAGRRAEALRGVVERTVVSLPDGTSAAVTASVGVSAAHGTECAVLPLLTAADFAMFLAKNDGGNQVHWWPVKHAAT
jgi:two-component system cell cycle response regulator